MLLGDLDGDGDLDLALRGPDPEGTMTVAWNDPRPRCLDLNGDSEPDECQPPVTETNFTRGDGNADGFLDLADPISLLYYLFDGMPLSCQKSADADDNGILDLTDANFLLTYMFLTGEAPHDPFRSCGREPTPDGLSCRRFHPCE